MQLQAQARIDRGNLSAIPNQRQTRRLATWQRRAATDRLALTGCVLATSLHSTLLETSRLDVLPPPWRDCRRSLQPRWLSL